MSYKQKPVTEEKIPYTDRINEIIKAHDDANIVYVLNGDDYHEMEFEDAIKAKSNTLKKYVTSIYRIKTQKHFVSGELTDEALIYWMQREVETFNGPRIQDDRIFGMLFKPNTRANRNAQGKSSNYTKINDRPFFKKPFSAKEVDNIINSSDIGVKNFYVAYGSDTGPDITSGIVYAIHNKDDFKKGTFEELYDMGKFNYTTREPRLDLWRQEGNEIRKRINDFSILKQGVNG